MKSKYLLTFFFALMATLVFVGCGDDYDGPAVSHPSYRDGVFADTNLVVTLDGAELTHASMVKITSEQRSYTVERDPETGEVISSRTDYNSTVRVWGFPTVRNDITFETISTNLGFEGSVEIDGVGYDYVGEFTGHPLHTHDKQGLILQFTTR